MFEDIRENKKQYLADCKEKGVSPSHDTILYPVIFVDNGSRFNNICENTLYNLSCQLEIIRRGRKDEFEKNHMNELNFSGLNQDSRNTLSVNYYLELTEEILMYIKSSCITNFTTAIEFSKFHEFGFSDLYNIPLRFSRLMDDNINFVRQYLKDFTIKIMKLDADSSDKNVIDLEAFMTNLSFQMAQLLFRIMNQSIEEEINTLNATWSSSVISDMLKDSFTKMGIDYKKLSNIKCTLIIKNLLMGLPQTMYDNFLLPMCYSILCYMAGTTRRISIY